MKKVLLWGGGAIVAIGVIASVAGQGGTDKGGSTDSGTKQEQPAKAPEQKKVSGDEIYNQVQNGMTKEQVVQIAGRNFDNCIDSEIAGLGTSSTCSYGSVSIIFSNGKVQSKTKL